MKFKTIAIVGLGLMGGSLAAACRKKFPQSKIVGVSRDPKALAISLKKKWINEGTRDLKTGVSCADLVILCTPVDTLKSILLQVEKAAQPGTLVTDVGSVKGEIGLWAARHRFHNIEFVGAHPMAGSHERGITVARPDLYDKAFTFVTPAKKGGRAVIDFWKKICARVVIVSPQEHDRITAEISHLPHLAAVCLALAPQNKSFKHAGPGFSDATRIAQGHPSIWVPIFLANRKAVLQALQGFEKQLKGFKKALQKGGRGLDKILVQAVKRRRQISL